MRFYHIANKNICISENIALAKEWEIFRIKSIEEPLFTVNYASDTSYIHQVQHIIAPFNVKRSMTCGESVMLIDDDWSMCQMVCNGSEESRNSLLIQMYYTHMVKRHFIQIHSSLINYRGRGLLFLGPSGIGKTTQAELWQKYRGAQIINGDLAFVQKKENEFLGWGTPWHGSSPYCMNASVPVAALIVLKQAEKNSLRRLTGFTMVSEVSQSVFYPLWLEGGTELCLETLDALLRQIPVYELACRPDEASVSLLYRELIQKKLL